ncbi:hypothetical protein [Bradyrhizobium sp. WSM2793]|uniref:hypothetical protein n=1 Tax=Bradyrhizobium sp. WSM2793 TaxID=1038866 RepID=UPI0012F9F3A1|nr:hypothetical protein [Bradyrhizobium sp. WSM2793]
MQVEKKEEGREKHVAKKIAKRTKIGGRQAAQRIQALASPLVLCSTPLFHCSSSQITQNG